MDLQSISNSINSAAARVGSTSSRSSSAPPPPISGSSSSTTQVKISDRAQLLSKLQDLEKSDPAKAQKVLQSLASQVRDQAKTATGDEATHLNALADKLDKAASSGDLSALAPKQGGKAHHHHGGHPPPAADGSAPAADASGNQPASAAYAKQQSDAAQGQDKMRALWSTLNAAFDKLV